MLDDLSFKTRVVGDIFAASLTPRHGPIAANVILIPGSCHGWWAWRFWQPALAAAGYATHALSMPNHTDAPALPEAEFLRLTPQDYAERVAAVGRELPGPLVIIGHSLGGWVAQLAAVLLRPAALVPVASAGPDAVGTPRPPLDPGRPFLPSRAEAAAMWFADADPAIVEWTLDRLTGESPATRNTPRVLAPGAIGCPVLVVGAGRDRSAVPPQPALAAHLGAECVMFETAGHDLMLERQALAAVRAVIAWLDRVLPRA